MSLRFLTAGESHGPVLTVILDGCPAGLELSADMIQRDLIRRQQGYGASPRMKLEPDAVRILSGVMDGKTTGAPIALEIDNQDHAKWRGKAVEAMTAPRPGHADLTGALKYGYDDLRPSLERASARETAARVAMGAVCRSLLAEFHINVGGYVSSIGEIEADLASIPVEERIRLASGSEVNCPDSQASERMQERIRRVMDEKDTLGGVIEIATLGLPPGMGSFMQWDRRLEARLGAAVLSVQAVKGVEIGPAFANTHLPGTKVHDPILAEDGQIARPSNRCGGLEGGVTTGEPLLIRAAMKPIATTLTPQASVDLVSGESAPTRYERSDFCPVPRAVVVLEAMVCYVLADALIEKLGGDSLAEMLPRFDALPTGKLTDFHLDSNPHTWWPA